MTMFLVKMMDYIGGIDLISHLLGLKYPFFASLERYGTIIVDEPMCRYRKNPETMEENTKKETF